MRKCTINVIRMEKTREIPEKYVAIKEEMEQKLAEAIGKPVRMDVKVNEYGMMQAAVYAFAPKYDENDNEWRLFAQIEPESIGSNKGKYEAYVYGDAIAKRARPGGEALKSLRRDDKKSDAEMLKGTVSVIRDVFEGHDLKIKVMKQEHESI
jgi:hypothetical protein